MQLPNIGSRFLERYELRRLLGKGGFGAVYLAHDTTIARDVALKVLTPDESGVYRGAVASRFMVEARILAQLTDPHVIRMYAYGETDDGLLYMVSEYVEGLDLSKMLMMGSLEPDVALEIAEQVATALIEAHDAGVLHRDIKPANVLVYKSADTRHAVKLVDFGIAKVDPRDAGGKLTQTGRIVGTPRYMAPEQHFGEALGPGMDIYALGLVLYEMLVGHPALEGDHGAILRRAALDEPHRLPADFPAELSALVERLTEPQVARRFQTAREARDGIRLLRQLPSAPMRQVPPPPQPSPRVLHPVEPSVESKTAEERIRSNLRWLPLVSVGMLSGGGFVLYTTQERVQPEPAAPRTLPSALVAVRTPDVGEEQPKEASSSDAGLRADLSVPAPAVEHLPLRVTSEGCGRLHEPGVLDRKFDLGDPKKRGRFILPTGYEPKRKYPITVLFRDINLSSGQTANRLGFGLLASRFDDSVVLAFESSLNIDPVDVSPEQVVDLIEAGSREVCLDPSKVVLVGHGRGAMRAREASCAINVSAVVLSGWAEDPEFGCEPSPPVPTVWVHITQDRFNPAEGGIGCDGRHVIPMAEQRQRFIASHGCEEDGEDKRLGHADCEEFTCSKAALMSCSIEGGYYMQDTTWWFGQPNCPRDTHRNEVRGFGWDFVTEHARTLETAP